MTTLVNWSGDNALTETAALTERAARTHAPIVSSLGTEPWNRPWWKTADGDGATLYYILAIHLLAAIGLAFFPVPGWRVIVATVSIAWLGGLGVTVCFHRSLAHTAVRWTTL